jgi:kynurenine formamidase
MARPADGFSRSHAATSADPRIAAASPATTGQPPGKPANVEEAEAVYVRRRNWGRWGPDDPMGAVNLITAEKRTAAAALVKSGRTVSLSRLFEPQQHFVQLNERGTGGSVVDYYGFLYHGVAVTHVDALCHVWDRHGMWNGRDPAREIDTRGSRFADITAFGGGLITRGVLLDVPHHRREPYVTVGRPVLGSELADIARAQGVAIRPGDALLIYSGREAYVAAGNTYGGATAQRPGLDVSCATFVRDHDVAVLGWDMHDAMPDKNGLPWPVHGVIFSYGVALVDNALLEPLAAACAEERRYEFMFMALPLKVPRGTGSPANPVALF